jgi:2,3-dihydroxybiphenyl 1,2-dioxygenase
MTLGESSATTTPLFGAISLGYALIESRKLDDWQRFLQEGLGLHLACADSRTRAFRMDAHARRIIVRDGAAEDVASLGIEFPHEAAVETVLARLSARGIAGERVEGEQAAVRGVKSFVRFEGPKRLRLELFNDPHRAAEPLDMLTTGFVTGAGGFGHVAMTSRSPEPTLAFWQEVFDARLSDRVSQRLAGVMLDVAFLRLNERHHSVAVAATRGLRLDPIRTKVQHINLLAMNLDDVSSAYQRLRHLGYEIAHEIGQHPNDRELSFYVVSPSGFEFELGCDALTVDEATWQPADYDAISIWGHKPENGSTLHNLKMNVGNLVRGLRSLGASEYLPLGELP